MAVGCAAMTTFNKKYPNLSPLEVAVESNVEMIARDGVILRADVYHPKGSEKYPALVCRTPYQKLTPRYVETATDLAARGYCVVMQDFRGRYASDGDYEWMWRERTETHDTEDGYDTVEWAAKLEWSDGRVGMGALERKLGDLDDAGFTTAESGVNTRKWNLAKHPRHQFRNF
jgi:predicted acyl esterase